MSVQPVYTANGHKSKGRKFSLDIKEPKHQDQKGSDIIRLWQKITSKPLFPPSRLSVLLSVRMCVTLQRFIPLIAPDASTH